MISVACPKCRETWEVPDSQRGNLENCPACGQRAKVPVMAPPIASAAQPLPQPPRVPQAPVVRDTRIVAAGIMLIGFVGLLAGLVEMLADSVPAGGVIAAAGLLWIMLGLLAQVLCEIAHELRRIRLGLEQAPAPPLTREVKGPPSGPGSKTATAQGPRQDIPVDTSR